MRKRKPNILIFLMIASQLVPSVGSANNSFFNQNYRGWLWFEEKEQDQGTKPEAQRLDGAPSKEEMERAKLENEQFKEELENLRHMMVRYPDNLNYIRLYKEKEKQMLDGALILATNFAMVNFLNPDIADQLKNPQNIYGRNVNRAEKENQDMLTLKLLSSRVELFVFRQSDCAHCKLLEKHLNSFAIKYGFKVEAVAADNSTSSYFPTHQNPAIIEQLQLSVMPTVIAVTKDSKARFELARGAVSIPDLEDKALLLFEYLKNQDNVFKGRK